jgi:MFS family permease
MTKQALPDGHPADLDAADRSLCPWLTANPGESAAPTREPSNGGAVPRSLLVAVTLDMIGVGLIIPLMSVFAKELGAGAAFTGMLGTMYGLTQLIGASMLGPLSDAHGRKKVLQLSTLGAIVGYATLYVAVFHVRSLWLLAASRIPIGFAKQTLTAGRAAISDCSAADKRAGGLAKLGVATGIGFIIGPACGGILSSKFSKALPPQISVVLFLLELALITKFVPETAPSQVDGPREAKRAAEKAAAGGGKEDAKPAAAAAAAAAAATATATAATVAGKAAAGGQKAGDAAGGGPGDGGGIFKGLDQLHALTRRYPLLGSLLLARAVSDAGFMMVQVRGVHSAWCCARGSRVAREQCASSARAARVWGGGAPPSREGGGASRGRFEPPSAAARGRAPTRTHPHADPPQRGRAPAADSPPTPPRQPPRPSPDPVLRCTLSLVVPGGAC